MGIAGWVSIYCPSLVALGKVVVSCLLELLQSMCYSGIGPLPKYQERWERELFLHGLSSNGSGSFWRRGGRQRWEQFLAGRQQHNPERGTGCFGVMGPASGFEPSAGPGNFSSSCIVEVCSAWTPVGDNVNGGKMAPKNGDTVPVAASQLQGMAGSGHLAPE
eukprot:g33331.t1